MKKGSLFSKLLLIALSLVFIISSFTGCSVGKNRAIEKEVTSQISMMLGKESVDDGNILSKNLYSMRIFNDNDCANFIADEIDFKVKSVKVEEENKGTVSIKVKSPDVYKMLTKAAKEVKTEDSEKLLDNVSIQLDGKYPTIEKTIECDIQLINEKWVLIPNKELADALSGNLISAFGDIAHNKIDSMIGE